MTMNWTTKPDYNPNWVEDAFARIAEREGITVEQLRAHIAHVFATTTEEDYTRIKAELESTPGWFTKVQQPEPPKNWWQRITGIWSN